MTCEQAKILFNFQAFHQLKKKKDKPQVCLIIKVPHMDLLTISASVIEFSKKAKMHVPILGTANKLIPWVS